MGCDYFFNFVKKRSSLKVEFFIARKIRSGGVSGKKFAGPVLKVAVGGVMVGMIVMILTIAISSGFKREIREKIVGFGGHVQVENLDFNMSFEPNPIRYDSALVNSIKSLEGVRWVQRFASKAGIMSTEQNMQGVVLKGIGHEYDTTFLNSILVEGRLPNTSQETPANEILISALLSQMLYLEEGEEVFIYFFQEQIRVRRFTVVGIFDSNLPEFDKMNVVSDLRHVQRINNWNPDQVAGLEVITSDFDNVQYWGARIEAITAGHISPDGGLLRVRTVYDIHPQIFGWLDLLDMNLVVIIILIIMVAGFNMISGLLIMILERTKMIGVLKALGMEGWPLRKIFLFLATRVTIRGLVWGNAIGIGLCLIQHYFGLVKLDPANYFLDTVPIYLNPLHLLFLNAGVIVAIFLMMVGPSYMARKISPVRAILFD